MTFTHTSAAVRKDGVDLTRRGCHLISGYRIYVRHKYYSQGSETSRPDSSSKTLKKFKQSMTDQSPLCKILFIMK